MSAVPTPVTAHEIDDRRRLGIDKRDECWAGEWHLVNPPKRWHGLLAGDLYSLLKLLAEAKGLEAGMELGLFGAANDWRIPDHVYARPEDGIDEGYVSAELVVEVRSTGDDSYRKLGFYAARGVGEVLILHQDRRFELYRLGPDSVLARVKPGDDGAVDCEALGATFTTVAGPRLRVAWDGASAEV